MAAGPNRTYDRLDEAFDHFNRELFAGELPKVLLTKQRKRGSYGYFSGNRFAALGDPQQVVDEIALNPDHFDDGGEREVLSTLAHEMAHLWQHHRGKPSRSGYHNREWAAKMVEIGLIPTDTGKPGGKQTGQRVSHYVEDGGRFDRACAAFLAGGPVPLYVDRTARRRGATIPPGLVLVQEPEGAPEPGPANRNKVRYSCPKCGVNVWGKPGLELDCRPCAAALQPA